MNSYTHQPVSTSKQTTDKNLPPKKHSNALLLSPPLVTDTQSTND